MHPLMERYFDPLSRMLHKSDDPDVQVASIIITKNWGITCGCNHLPLGITPQYLKDENIRMGAVIVHAERAAIYEALNLGKPIYGATLLSTHHPCVNCAQAIIEVGIAKVVSKRPAFDNPKWGEEWKLASKMFNKANVILEYF